MKIIGTTREGNDIWEMTQDETRELVHLQKAVEGERSPFFDERLYFHTDLADVFKAIRLWFGLKFQVNEMRVAIDEIDDQLHPKETKQ